MVRPIFGVDRDPATYLGPRTNDGAFRNNPMLVLGQGPNGKQCADCQHLYYLHYAKRYYKCELRELSASVRTDHRVSWPACSKFEERTDE